MILIRHDYAGTRLYGESKEMMPHQCDLSDSGLKLSQKLKTMLAAIPQQRAGQLDEAQVVT